MLPSDYSSEDEWKEEKASMKVHIFGKRLKKAQTFYRKPKEDTENQ